MLSKKNNDTEKYDEFQLPKEQNFTPKLIISNNLMKQQISPQKNDVQENVRVCETVDNQVLLKLPGWRCRGVKQRPQTDFSSTLVKIAGHISETSVDVTKTDTSISSNGPLKEFIIFEKPSISHKTSIKFKLDEKLLSEAAAVADRFRTMKSIRSMEQQTSLTSIKDEDSIKVKADPKYPYKSIDNKQDQNDDCLSLISRWPSERIKLFLCQNDCHNSPILLFSSSKSTDEEHSIGKPANEPQKMDKENLANDYNPKLQPDKDER